jgi:hypothetical protein
VAKKGKIKGSDFVYGQYTSMFANWVQIEMGKTLKTIKFDHNNFKFL